MYWFLEKERNGGEEGEGRKEERERERERETPICSSTRVRIHWFSPVCALTWDQTHNLGKSGQCSNPLSSPARAQIFFLLNKCSREA